MGDGSTVEELMKAIAEHVQNLVKCHTVTLVSPTLYVKLEEIVEEMKSLEPSLPVDAAESQTQTFKTHEGTQIVSTNSSTQYNNTSSGTMNNFASIVGNPTFNQGKS